MKTKANIKNTGIAIADDIAILIGNEVGPSGVSWEDVVGTLAVNLRVLADALDEHREGRMEFVGGHTPIGALATIAGYADL